MLGITHDGYITILTRNKLNLFSLRGTALDLNQHGKSFFVNTLLYICNCRATTSFIYIA